MRMRLLVSLLVVGSVAGCTSSNDGGAGSDASTHDGAMTTDDASTHDGAMTTDDASMHDGAMTTDDASMHDASMHDGAMVTDDAGQDATTAVDAGDQVDAAMVDASDAMVDAADPMEGDASDAMVDAADPMEGDASDAMVEDASDADAYIPDDASVGPDGAVDINECDDDNGGCDPLTTCTDTEDSRICGPCPGGHSGDGETGCIAASGATCLSILANDSGAISGVYLIDPSGSDAFPVYCDMTTDGGGWTKILQYHDVSYTPTADAVGDITTAGTPAFAKLADAQINAFGAMPTYRISGTRTTKSVYITTDASFSDTSVGFGLMVNAPTRVCESETFDTCAFTTTTLVYLDTLHWGLVGNDSERYFADYAGGEVNCYTPSESQVRCINAGNTTNHAFIDDISMWIRESGLVAHWTLDEGSGTTISDSSGHDYTMTVHSGTWTDGVLDGGFHGIAYTDSALPDLDRVSVSLWVRHAGNVNHLPRIFGWYQDRFELADYAGTGTIWLYTPEISWQNTGAALPNDIYAHVAVTVGDGVARVYVGGVLVADYASSIALNGPFFLGTRGSPLGSEAFDGSTDQIRIYDRVLTANEVAALAAE